MDVMTAITEFTNASDRRQWLLEHLAPCGTVTMVPFDDRGVNLLLMPRGDVQRLIITHYDTYFGFSGANDNSSGCVQLLCAALQSWHPDGHVAIAFTDMEEQHALGAHALAKWFTEHGGIPQEVIVFDTTGIGDCWVFDGDNPQVIKELMRATGFERAVSPIALTGDSIAFPGSLECCVMVKEELDDLGFPLSWTSLHTDFDTVDDIWPTTMESVTRAICAMLNR